uniref:Uncharacterized protein n=1 Tax=Gopherus agassizii TaxID=38772 RepID=A0A452I5S9_9SAUR
MQTPGMGLPAPTPACRERRRSLPAESRAVRLRAACVLCLPAGGGLGRQPQGERVSAVPLRNPQGQRACVLEFGQRPSARGVRLVGVRREAGTQCLGWAVPLGGGCCG